jgi:hypothetical protein
LLALWWMTLVGVALGAEPVDEAVDEAVDTCSIVVTFGGRAQVHDVEFRSCDRALHSDLDARVRQVPWELAVGDVILRISHGETEDWTLNLRLQVVAGAPVNTLPTDGAAARTLSDRFTAPSPDRRVRLLSAVLTPPPNGVAIIADIASAATTGTAPTINQNTGIPLYHRRSMLKQVEKGGVDWSAGCTAWVVFDEAGKPVDLMRHPEGSCTRVHGPLIEALLWRWTPARWDGRPARIGVPIEHTGVGVFGVGTRERFTPFFAGDVLVSDVPYALAVPRGGRPSLTAPPSMEIPMVFPELLEARLGLEDASRIACEVHLWAAPGLSTPYALAVRGCPEFFGSVVLRAYEHAKVTPPAEATEHLETVVFSFDDAAETWRINRQ